jgi:hypothetical protein
MTAGKLDIQYGFQLLCTLYDKILSAKDSSLDTSLYIPNLRPFFSRTLKGENKIIEAFL